MGRLARVKNRLGNIAAQTALLRNYIVSRPDCSTSEIEQDLKMTRTTLYQYLYGLTGDPGVYQGQEFFIRENGKRLQLEDIEIFLRGASRTNQAGPKPAERLLYLYYNLHGALPYGGLTLDSIMDTYVELMLNSGRRRRPATSALKRMIYRDLEELERIGIIIDRPSTGSPKYCLHEQYLPKLTPESAAAVYVSMLLFRNTLLDKATTGAKRELEKAFFKRISVEADIFQDRIYVLGDTLAHPEEFGDVLGKLVRAVLESYEVRIDYVNVEGKESLRLLQPVGMVCKRGVWYVIGRLPDNGEYRTFRVDQVLAVYPHEDRAFRYPEGFSISGHIGDSWGVFCNDPVQLVLLKFSPAVACRVKNLRYHPSQQMVEEREDGSIILQFEACGLLELKNWILQWGTEVEVLKPVELRRQVAKVARAVAKQYQQKKK